MQTLSKATLESLDSPKVNAIVFVSKLRNLPDNFAWDYERVEGDWGGCAIALASYLGMIKSRTSYELADVLGMNQKKVHAACYHLHNERNVLLKDVTAGMVADALEALI